MPKKKTIGFITVLLIVMVGAFWLQNHKWSPDIQHKGVVISNWNSGMGAVDEDNLNNLDKQKLSFTATIWNDSTKQTYITDVKLIVPETLRSRILTGDTVVSVNRELNLNASYQVKGDLILDTKGMTKEEVVNLGNIQEFIIENSN
jgi:hypothetical protein